VTPAPPEFLALGTAQLGFPYGVANTSGQPDQDRALEIVDAFWESGARWFDTARGYGASEEVLGRCLKRLGASDDALVVTKFAPDPDRPAESAISSARASLDALGIPRLAGIMLHREEDLDLWDQGIGDAAGELARSGLAASVGVSVYSPRAALRALAMDAIGMVQIPSSALDARFLRAGVFDEARRTGKRIFVRSLFLQGLLLLAPAALPARLGYAAATLAGFLGICAAHGVTPLRACLGYARERFPGAVLVFGAETPAQVRLNMEAAGAPLPPGLAEELEAAFADVPDSILNPALWPKE